MFVCCRLGVAVATPCKQGVVKVSPCVRVTITRLLIVVVCVWCGLWCLVCGVRWIDRMEELPVEVFQRMVFDMRVLDAKDVAMVKQTSRRLRYNLSAEFPTLLHKALMGPEWCGRRGEWRAAEVAVKRRMWGRVWGGMAWMPLEEVRKGVEDAIKDRRLVLKERGEGGEGEGGGMLAVCRAVEAYGSAVDRAVDRGGGGGGEGGGDGKMEEWLIMMACVANHVETLTTLLTLERGVDVDNVMGIMAVVFDSDDVLRWLWAWTTERVGEERLFLIWQEWVESCQSNDSSRALSVLIDPKVIQTLPSERANTVLASALSLGAAHGSHRVVSCLLHHPDIDPNQNSGHALRISARRGHNNVVIALLSDPRVDPNVMEYAPLKWAASANRVSVVATLLSDPRVSSSGIPHKLLHPHRLRSTHPDIAAMLQSHPPQP